MAREHPANAEEATPLQHTSEAKDNHHLFEVRETEGKGLGIFAKEDIRRGTLVLSETPLFSFNSSDGTTDAALLSAFANLPSLETQAYLDLHAYLPPDYPVVNISEEGRKVLGVYSANAWAGGVVDLGSRFNHSCVPNVHLSHDPRTQIYDFRLVRDVKAGEELTASYISLFLTRKERQDNLVRWGFECACPACEKTTDGKKIEEKRVKLRNVYHEMRTVQYNAATDVQLLKSYRFKYQQIAALMRSLGLVSSFLRKSYYEAALISAVLGEGKMALSWAEKGADIMLCLYGERQSYYNMDLNVITQLQAAVEGNKTFQFEDIRWPAGWGQDFPN
ncbi:hypothetical protein E6O75_ATG05096 [Venturia nashicola]|uniref:SET domain-containing protein n=1 Tax=Venturia nashicola TaxID=86259 RepID=A0A4Z1P9U5_9PEZI|nr:hypothetical protein E6O75_ATG05096 [Venturia nashicola]